MKKLSMLMVVCLSLFAMVPSAMAILAGINPDVHMDIPGAVANDFHIEGRIVSGWPGQGWSQPPVLVHHEDGGFPDFSYSIVPDYASPDQNEYIFRADWKGKNFRYCEWLHLGLVFDLTCHNLAIDLVGWWTYDGERIAAGQNQGTVLLPGFIVEDLRDNGPQKIQIRNDSGAEDQGMPGISGEVVRMELLALKQNDVIDQFGSLLGLFQELRKDGAGGPGGELDPMFKPVEFETGTPDFHVDSFFDVYFDIEIPNNPNGIPLEAGDILVSRIQVAYPDNAGQQELHWTWHMHESHGEDFGDAPDPTYPTLRASNGARHIIRGPWLGDRTDIPDGEQDGQPHPTANGDDTFDANDDEDGVLLPGLVQGQPANIQLQVNNGGGVVDAWIDFNNNGIWEPAEQIHNTFLPQGNHTITINVPNIGSAQIYKTFARFRISVQGGLAPDGPIDNGEVEDYQVTIRPATEPEVDFGDAPDSPNAPTYPTLRVNNGARHRLTGLYLGNLIDAETDGQPNVTATGDDMNPASADDEDGVTFLTDPLIPTRTAKVQIVASQDGILQGWVDFAADGGWAEPSDQIFQNVPVSAGVNNLSFLVPLSAKSNTVTYARFRLASVRGLGYDGSAEDGEVEDYLVRIGERCGIKWMQRPDETPMGIDIRVDSKDNIRRVLADDFECRSIDRITDVHLWGSWKDDIKGRILNIHLSIYSDDPVGPGGSDPANNYSKPDELLWQYDVTPKHFREHLYAQLERGEYWWDPFGADNILIPEGDHQIWQVDIFIGPEDAFLQKGTPDKPIVYWLCVEVRLDPDVEGEFGWKTRRWPEHYNDDAVRSGAAVPWIELRYPKGHPLHEMERDSIDMAFAITNEKYCPENADLDCDGFVGLKDFAIMSSQWLTKP